MWAEDCFFHRKSFCTIWFITYIIMTKWLIFLKADGIWLKKRKETIPKVTVSHESMHWERRSEPGHNQQSSSLKKLGTSRSRCTILSSPPLKQSCSQQWRCPKPRGDKLWCLFWGLLKPRYLSPTPPTPTPPRFSRSGGGVGVSKEFAFCTSFQVLLLLVVWDPTEHQDPGRSYKGSLKKTGSVPKDGS